MKPDPQFECLSSTTNLRCSTRIDRFSADLRTVAIRNDGKYAGLPTSTPLDEAIFGTLVRARGVA